MVDVLGKISKFFSIPGNVGAALNDIFEGVANEFIGIPQGVWLGALDISVFVQYVWEFFITNFACGMKLMQNIQYCAIYYILDILGQILYLPFRITLWIINKFIPGSYNKIENAIWGNLDIADRWTIENLGFHIIHFSKPVRDKCYNCKRLRPLVFIGKTNEVIADLGDPIIPFFVDGLAQMVRGLGRLVNAFNV